MRKQHDLIEQLRDLLLREGVDEAWIKDVDKQIKLEVTRARFCT